jgi:hypothetical protein
LLNPVHKHRHSLLLFVDIDEDDGSSNLGRGGLGQRFFLADMGVIVPAHVGAIAIGPCERLSCRLRRF